ncbi:methyltransferase [Mycobacterium tuberculosis]|nr:hypothetical protein [Mycobacterium tuberculosis]CLS34746.1 methyltransferase [Mycobacterium tuberculosis]
MRVSVANHLGEDAGHLALRRDVYSGLQKTPKRSARPTQMPD